MPIRPKFVLFDALETLFSLDPLRDALNNAGASGELLPLWFARTLRDGFALAASNTYRPFKIVAAAALSGVAFDFGYTIDADGIGSVMETFAELPAHPDVADAFEILDGSDVGVAVFSNGSAEVMRKLLEKNGLTTLVKQVVSIDDAQAWKPRAEAYWVAADMVGHEPQHCALVAAHAWDCHGAKQAGLTTGWIRRSETNYTTAMIPADVNGDSLTQLCIKLLEL